MISDHAYVVRIVLRGAAELVRKGWTRGALARDQTGAPIHHTDSGACSFCLAGALSRSLHDQERRGRVLVGLLYLEGLIASRVAHHAGGSLTRWNDTIAKNGHEVASLLETVAADIL